MHRSIPSSLLAMNSMGLHTPEKLAWTGSKQWALSTDSIGKQWAGHITVKGISTHTNH